MSDEQHELPQRDPVRPEPSNWFFLDRIEGEHLKPDDRKLNPTSLENQSVPLGFESVGFTERPDVKIVHILDRRLCHLDNRNVAVELELRKSGRAAFLEYLATVVVFATDEDAAKFCDVRSLKQCAIIRSRDAESRDVISPEGETVALTFDQHQVRDPEAARFLQPPETVGGRPAFGLVPDETLVSRQGETRPRFSSATPMSVRNLGSNPLAFANCLRVKMGVFPSAALRVELPMLE